MPESSSSSQQQPGRAPNSSKEDTRQPRTVEEALARLEAFASGRGQLVVSDGLVDVRLTVERGAVELELDGAPLPAVDGSPDRAIVRAFVQTLFWTSPAIDLVGSKTGAVSGAPPQEAAERPKLRVERADAPAQICRAIADEIARLDATRKKVPSLRVIAGPTGTTKTAKGGDTLAGKLRAALVAKNGELPLADWAKSENVDPVDAVNAFADLLDSGEARVARKQDPSASSARTASSLGGGGFVAGLRLERAARSLVGRDDALAASALRRAGWARLSWGRFAEAIDDFNQSLASDAGKADEPGIEAREGLIAALDAQIDHLRRTAQDPDPALAAEAKRTALDLGRAYLQLGLMNRARAALERAVDDRAAPGTMLELVTALVGAGQIGRAIERAEALAPKLDRAARRALALRFVQGGAKGPSLERALAMAGAQRERRQAKGLLAAGGVALVAGAALSFHAFGLAALAAASDEVARRLTTEPPTAKLAEPFEAVAGRFSFTPVAALANERAARIKDIVHDGAELEARRSALLWRTAPDATVARASLKAFLDAVKTTELRVGLTAALGRFDAWASAATSEIEALRAFALHGDAVQSLDAANRIRALYPAYRDRWKDILIPIRVDTVPAEVTLDWNGARQPAGTTLLYFPLEKGEGGQLRITPEVPGYGPVERKIALDDGPFVHIELPRTTPTSDARRNPGATTPPPPGPGPSTPNPAPSATPKPRIKISAEPSPAPAPDDGAAPKKTTRFDVRETPGAALQEALGGSPITIQPTPGFFDYLKPEILERFRLTVEVVTAARDGKVYLDAVKLHLEDLALAKPIPPRTVELDPPCERPVRGLEGGGRTVEVLGRTLHLDSARLREDLLDELRTMMSDFNRREQSSGSR